jgi:hypothetical protein
MMRRAGPVVKEEALPCLQDVAELYGLWRRNRDSLKAYTQNCPAYALEASTAMIRSTSDSSL